MPTNEAVLPANLVEIVDEYQDILYSGPEQLVEYKRTTNKLLVIIPLIEHPIYGKTALYITEKYGDAGYVTRYSYAWRKFIPRQGVQSGHISSWENEPHNQPGTPDCFITETEPHHHHHVPGDRSQRQANYNVRTARQAFEFVAPYLREGSEYIPIQVQPLV